MKILLQAIKSLLRGIEARLTKLLTDNIDSEINSHLAGKLNKNNPVATGSFSLGREEGTEVGGNSFAAGSEIVASGVCSHAEGYFTTASGFHAHAEGYGTNARGDDAHAEGYSTSASGDYSHAEGYCTQASSDYQHVQGKSNVEDGAGTYAHIVGNGINEYNRSNAHTLDWDGNAWFAGTVEGTALILKSSTANSTKRFRITVDDSGTLSATEITA